MCEAIVQCQDVACGYQGRAVVEGVNLRIEPKEIVTILGGSGSGKSTLLRTLVGLLPPLSGQVRLFGQDLYTLPQKARSALLRHTGMLFQQDALFTSMTLLENVMFPLRELTALPEPVMRRMALMKLALVDLAQLEDRLPSEVSGGQRKRAALARTSILDPDLLFCDEPTSGLDPIMAAQLDRTLLRFRSVLDITIIAVTHDLESARTISDRALMVGNGQICAQGPIEALERSDDAFVRAFFERATVERSTRSEVSP